MDILMKGTLALIRTAITGEASVLPEDFQIDQAADMIRRHKVTGLAYEGAIKCGIDKQCITMQEMFKRYYADIIRHEQQMALLKKLETAFQENGIDYLPLKGTILKPLYPQPAARVMGDADILIRIEQYEKLKAVMESLQFDEGKESDHELVWSKKPLYLELHKRMMPSYTADFFEYFEKGWQRAFQEQGSRHTFRPEDHFIYLFVHYAKHYRREGIGIRQPVDLWVFQRSYPDMDIVYIENELEQLNLVAFFRYTQQMLGTWFDGKKEDDRTSFMSNYIWNSGSWGTFQSAQAFKGFKSEKAVGSRTKSKLTYLMQVIFPPASILKNRYPVLDKAPWLLPVLWPVRWVSALLFRHKNIRKYNSIIKNRSGNKVDSFLNALDYVGLDPE